VYPVIEGAKDDQPELDFPQDVEDEEPSVAAGKKNAGPSTASLLRKDSAQDDTSSKGGRKTKAKATKGKAAKTEKLFESKRALRAASDMYEELRGGALSGLRLGLLHGRLSADDKEVTMRCFQRGDIDVLIATTVIEVGVDVPNASVMVIEHAERFGLAQMHQLRGRVGRGAAKSFCILMTGGRVSEQAEARLDAMVRTQNGFELAELDLQQRGPGEFFGTRQAGLPEFRVANLIRDRAVLELAKVEAARFASEPDPHVSPVEKDAVWARLKMQWQRKYGLVEA
jgi:ATP-dependent DNA helicase RecG